MISEKNFTNASVAAFMDQSIKNQAFLRKIMATKVIDWDELISILAINKSLLEFAASEIDRVSRAGACPPEIQALQGKIAQFRQSRSVQ